MNIVEMTADHVIQIAQLERECFSDPWSQNSIASELENPLSYWLVAMAGNVVAGYVGSQTVLGESDMMNLAVRGEFRRQGVARDLVLALIDGLSQRGSHCLTLEVRESNTPARKLYEKLGFVQVGIRPNYYQHPREDGLILRKEWER